MFGVASPRRWVYALLLGLVALTVFGLAGCGEPEEVDPYVYDTLRRVTRGDTLSPGFLFEIDMPDVEYVDGDVAIVRDGNLLEFLVGKDLEQNIASLKGTLIGVKKTFTPQPTHLVLQRIKRNGVIEADSLAAPTGYVLPRLLRAGAIDLETPGAPLPEIGWSRRAIEDAAATFLPEEEGEPLKKVQSGIEHFVHVPRHDLDEEAAANPGPEDYAWYAVFDEPNTAMEIVNLTPGAEWMLKMFLAKDLPIVGSFSVVRLEDDYTARRVEHEGLGHVVGDLQINWFKYANTFVQGSERD